MRRRYVLAGGLAGVGAAVFFKLASHGEGRSRDPLASDPEGRSYVYLDGWIVALR